VVFTSFVVAPAVFGAVDSETAGVVMGRIFPRYYAFTATCEPLADGMPKADGLLTILPAQQHRRAVELAEKVDETEVEILELATELLDFDHDRFQRLDVRRELGMHPHDVGRRRQLGSDLAAIERAPDRARGTLQPLHQHLEPRDQAIRFRDAEAA
jgi:hypothetical protein